MGWIQTLGKGALGKVGYLVLEWICKQVGIPSGSIPGSGKKDVSPKSFMNFLKDGVTLAKFANIMKPGSIANIFERPADKSQETANLSGFLDFAKNFAGVGESDLFKAEEANKGKGFPNVLNTLINVGANSSQNLGKEGLNMEQLTSTALQSAGKGFLSDLLGKIGLGKK